MPPLHVFDLPQLYTKPSADVIIHTLTLLTSSPLSWETKLNIEREEFEDKKGAEDLRAQVDPEGVARYLTSIVSSNLSWIQDDELKETIWTKASARLSERSGRTAMGAMSRKFGIPNGPNSFELDIHEPTLTGDDLGLKTWAASYLLAKRLHAFDLVPANPHVRLKVLELGSGTGLVGLAMAGLGTDVVLTDLPSICPNLAYNVTENKQVFTRYGGSAQVAVLDWMQPKICQPYSVEDETGGDNNVRIKFPLILAADSLYSSDHPQMLTDTVDEWLSDDPGAKVIVEFPYRNAYLPEIKDFRRRMQDIGLSILEEGEEKGYDDWAHSGSEQEDDARMIVPCWWSCWVRHNASRAD